MKVQLSFIYHLHNDIHSFNMQKAYRPDKI